ncbi:hypothetical protein NLJ89_g1205 [Agrocybe chaxingu]|uniref:Uncharacterized protein n=1 Tax=Agrocybe chaxingu TaxID=84603 RepID=A0A9W8N0J2_9AGAR|nr:hypothetical protein NLJ89_g1205 [Agrocybe chaxingu]
MQERGQREGRTGSTMARGSSRTSVTELGEGSQFDHDDAERGSTARQGHHPHPPTPPSSSRRRLFQGVGGYFRTLGRSYARTANVKVPAAVNGYDSTNSNTRSGNGKSLSQIPLAAPSIPLHADPYVVDDEQRRLPYTNLPDHPRKHSPDDYRRSTSSSARQWLSGVPEDAEMSIDVVDPAASAARARSGSGAGLPPSGSAYYGSISQTDVRFPMSSSPELEEGSELSEEEEEWLLDEELAREGLYRGNYKSLILLYTFVPLSTLLTFVTLGLLPFFLLRSSTPSPFPYSSYLPFPLPELLTAAALWSLSYLLRDSLYAISLFLTSLIPFPRHRFPSFIPVLTSTISAFLQSASTLILRQLAIPILLIPFYSTQQPQTLALAGIEDDALHRAHFPTWQDGAFRRVWWVALGWAVAEAVVGIKQGYDNIALYADVLVSVRKSVGKDEALAALASRQGGEPAESQKKSAASAVAQMSAADEESVTPTQRNWDSRRDAALSALPQRREHSDSLSSSNSEIRRSTTLEELGGSGLGERQPLLTLNRPPPLNGASLTRQTTQESERLLVENEVEQDLDELLRMRAREELEEVYGIPVIQIPVFISCLHRINSILSSLGVTLILTAAYMRSTLVSYPPPGSPPPTTSLSLRSFYSVIFNSGTPEPSDPSTTTSVSSSLHPFQPSNHALLLAFPGLLLIHAILSFMHTPWVLPRIGIHTFVYIGLLVWLSVFFGGLGVWEALT